jgi:hydrogenase maturation factor
MYTENGDGMKAGKLSESVLKRSVLKQLDIGHRDQPVRPAVGIDFGALKIGKDEIVIAAVESRCLGTAFLREAGVYAAVNNVACSGARPLGVLADILMPTDANENDLREQIAAINRVCRELELAILGGHTEITRSVTEPLLMVTAIGAVPDGKLVTGDAARPGMDIIVSKWIGIEGTVIVSRQYEETLADHFSMPFVMQAQQLADYLSVQQEAGIAVGTGVSAMHDLSEGGVLGALWEMAECSGIGLEIDLKKVPIRQETVELCEYFDLNPYKLVSGGSLLMAAEDGNAIVRAIEAAGGKATVIGKATDGNDRILRNGEDCRFLETTQTDELWKMR